MVQCNVLVAKEEKSSCKWQHLAGRKVPQTLGSSTLTSVAKSIAELDLKDVHKCKDSLRTACYHLNTSFPLNLRTAVVEEVVSQQVIEEAKHAISVILLHLLTDVRSFVLTTSVRSGDSIHLERDDCDFLLKELEGTHQFHLESLKVDGVSMETGIISEIIRKSPQIHTIRASGDLCKEILQCLEKHPRSLHSLQLDSALVYDREVVKALLGSQYDFETLGNMICEGKGCEAVERIPHQSLCHLSVDSPFLTSCGVMVILHYLQNLVSIRYSHSLFNSISCLQRFSSSRPQRLSLTSMELWSPSTATFSSLQEICPSLRHLMIENIDLSPEALQEELSAFTNLRSLTLRQVPEDHILSAVKAVGKNLQRLRIESETSTCISLDIVQSIQSTCKSLESLEMENVQISMASGDRLSAFKTPQLPQLKTLEFSKSSIHPAILERFLVGNNCMESLLLDVNQDALTDPMLNTMLKYNTFDKLSSISLSGGALSLNALTSLLALPALTELSLNIEGFPCIPEEAFLSLRKELMEGNYRCALNKVVHE